ncbi:MAG: heparinase II/III family protein [Pseudomonadota bacterium]
MALPKDLSARWTRTMNALAARRAAMGRPSTAFMAQPEPRTIGSFARGKQLSAGNFLFAGHLLQRPDTSMWDLPTPEHAFAEALHGFGWLDDIVAAGDAPDRVVAQQWLWAWIDRFGNGQGPGWTPDLTGRRLIRWISHALFLLSGQEADASHAFHRSLAMQTIFLGRRWKASAPGLPRFEALTGLIYASVSLEGMEGHFAPAIAGLDRECKEQIDEQGGLPTRNPEELLEVFSLLTWASVVMGLAGQQVSDAHWHAIKRIAPTLRTLRHSDGSLARFHGGGRGLEGRLDHALANSGVKTRKPDGLSMGFSRLSAGRTSVIVDAAPPPARRASGDAHASTLAFEMTSGRRPLIVNCGSGANFGIDWRRAGRSTPSHSTLTLNDQSSAQLDQDSDNHEYLINGPANVPIKVSQTPDGHLFEAGHDGYVTDYGLTHVRKLELSFDGRSLVGEDMLLAISDTDKERFDASLDKTALEGLPFEIRFHLHPDVDVSIDMGGNAVSLALMSGEIWLLRTEGAEIIVEPSVYLEKTRLKPRASKQVVLNSRAQEYATQLRWSMSKPQDIPVGIRDLAQTGLDKVEF